MTAASGDYSADKTSADLESGEPISSEQVKKISRLASLVVEDSELVPLASELNAILDCVRKLWQVPLEGAEATSHSDSELVNVFREDRVLVRGSLPEAAFPVSDQAVGLSTDSHQIRSDGEISEEDIFTTEAALANAPEAAGPYFKVPLVVEG